MVDISTIKTSVVPNGLKIESIPMDEVRNVKPVVKKVEDDNDYLFNCKVDLYKIVLKRGSMPPVILDSNNNIFDGQCRYRAHVEIGAKFILCMRTA